jgi:hypothetical protein
MDEVFKTVEGTLELKQNFSRVVAVPGRVV